MNDEQFKQQVLEQFAALNGRLDKVETGLSEVRHDFGKGLGALRSDMKKDVADLRSDMDKGFADLKADVGTVYDGVREVLDQQDIEAKERIHMDIVLKRHERWINGLARHADLKLNPS
jgi:hypothetical protein